MKLVKGLRELDHDVEVVTVNEESFVFSGYTSDQDLTRLLPAGVVNHRVWSWEKNPALRCLKASSMGRVLFRGLLEPKKKEWVFPAVRLLRKLELSDFDVVLSCSQPHSNHLIGLAVRRMTGKPWVAYFSDPWTDMPWETHESPRIAAYNRHLERQVVGEADALLFTSQEMLDLVMAKYPREWKAKCGVLPHCYVPQWYGNLDLGDRKVEQNTRRTLRFVHTGHFYGARRPLPLFRALAELNREEPVGQRAHFVFFGSMEAQDVDFLRDHGLETCVTVRNTIPYLDSLREMRDSDCLLLVDAPLQRLSESVFLPSKLVDYLGSGRPVLGITPKAGTSARVLAETSNLWCDVADSAGIKKVLRAIIYDENGGLIQGTSAPTYHFQRTSRALDRVLDRLIDKTSRTVAVRRLRIE